MRNLKKTLLMAGVVLAALRFSAFTVHAEVNGGYIPDRFSAPYPVEQNDEIPFVKAGSEDLSQPVYRTPNLPPVRNQNPYGSCWAFSSIACCEINLIKKGYYNIDDIDLSEMHMAYFGVYSANDPLGGLDGDVREHTVNHTAEKDACFLDAGGNYEMALNALADWMGVVPEDKMRYSDVETVFASIAAGTRKTEYDKYAFDSVARLKGYIQVPMADRNQVKQAILDYGAVGISYYHDPTDANYNEEYKSYYYNGSENVNHAVTIVGWDDTFETSKFKGSPGENGAWIVRNSWGDKWGDGGYFYLSYACGGSGLSGSAVAFDMEPAKEDEHNYQYDGMSYSMELSSIGDLKIASIFKAQWPSGVEEKIQALSFEAKLNEGSSSGTFTAEVYTGLKEGDNPCSSAGGKPVATVTGTVNQNGMYKVNLPETSSVANGEKFSVVLTLNGIGILVDRSYNVTPRSQTSSSKQGECFEWTGSSWGDFKNYVYSEKPDIQEMVRNGSLRIKAYTVDDPPIVIPMESIALNKTSLTLDVTTKKTAKLAIIITPDDATDRLVDWSSSDENVATVDFEGNVTPVGAGTAIIKATSHSDPTIFASCEIKCVVPVSAVSMQKTATLFQEDSIALQATVAPEDATDKSLKWTSSNTDVVWVDENGLVTAKAIGTAKITAQAMDGSGKKAECTVTVKAKIIKAAEVTLDKTTLVLIEGETEKLTETVAPDYTTDKSVKWSSSASKVASVDNTGIVTAKSAGTAVITVETKDGSGKQATCTVTVTAKEVKATGITLNKAELELVEGESEKLTELVIPKNTTDKSVKWSSSDSKVAEVDNSGLVTAKAPGAATITVETLDGSDKRASCTVTVQAKDSEEEDKKDDSTEDADKDPSGGEDSDKDSSKDTSDKGSDKDKDTSKDKDTDKDKDTSKDKDTDKDKDTNKDKDVVIKATAVVLNKTSLSINVDDTETLKATISPASTTDKSVKWSSSDTSVVTVDMDGKVVAKAVGTAQVTVQTADGSKKASCTVTVKGKDGWSSVGGENYWYEDGVRQGYDPDDKDYRGKEIYDPVSDAWYWLDNVLQGAIAKSKDVYQESFAGDWGDIDNGDGTRSGKWVRYDSEGHMVKGWCAGSGADAVKIDSANKAGDKAVYYFDETYGTMAKGYAAINGKEYYFNPVDGTLERELGEVPENGWMERDGKFYWFEKHARKGYSIQESYRGKEIFDEVSNAWYWLDNVQEGAKAVSKDVYQVSLAGDWGDIDNGDGTRSGKWVRYDAEGHMIKGWCVGEGEDAVKIKASEVSSSKASGKAVYYFDETYGTMAKGSCVIDGKIYEFDQSTGILR